MATQLNSKKSKKEKPMNRDIISRALTTTCPLELEYRKPSFLQDSGTGFEPYMLMEGIGERPLIDELAGFASAIWA
jgi:hypothetical protein